MDLPATTTLATKDIEQELVFFAYKTILFLTQCAKFLMLNYYL